MRIVVHGQEAFGKAVLEKLLERNENVVAVCCAPDKAGRPGRAFLSTSPRAGRRRKRSSS
jgi:methionyl-tRNA formyltransferase